MRFAANLSTLWPDLDPYARFDRAAAAGFRQVEYLFPHLLDTERVRRALKANDLELVLFDLDPGDLSKGERGMLCHPGREAAFTRSVHDGLALSAKLGAQRVNCLVGIRPPEVAPELARETAIRNLAAAVPYCRSAGVVLLIEGINQYDRPGYFANSVGAAADLVSAASTPSVRLLFDQYHATVTGDPLADLDRYFELVGHVQIADVPGRHQPGTGSAPIFEFLGCLRDRGYVDHVGLEYIPLGPTEASFEWLDSWRD